MSWSRGWKEGFKHCSNIFPFSTLYAHKKSEPCKEKPVSSYLGILYPAPKIWNPNLNFKLCWHKILPLAPRDYLLLSPTWIFLGIWDSRRFFSGVLLCFSLLGFTMLLLSWGTKRMVKWLNGKTNISPLGFYYAYPFLGNYINHQKDKIAYVPLDPIADYVYIEDVNTRLRVSWKTLPNLNIKLEFQK